jgi:hypothetical protein
MRWLLVAIAALALCASGADKKKSSEVEIVLFQAVHDGSDITVDGSVRSVVEKPIQDLVLEFEFLASGKQVVTTRRVAVDEPTLQKGDEAAFHAATAYPQNAIQILVRAYAGGGNSGGLELIVANPGPYPIEN